MAAPFDREKFKELVLYIAQTCASDGGFGKTKLNKALWWSDFQAYARLGRPLTGAKYMRLPWGPVPRPLLPVLAELEQEKAIYFENRVVYGGKTQERLRARRRPDMSAFSKEEVKLIDSVVAALWGKKATGVSNLSHEKSAGWRLAAHKENIPYETVFVSARKAKAVDRAWARDVAAKHGWVAS